MDDGHTGSTEDSGQWGRVDRQRVDQCHLVGPGDLNQSQVGHVGTLGVELGVEAVGVLGGHLGDESLKRLRIGDDGGRSGHRGVPGGDPGSGALVFSTGEGDFMVPARRVSVLPGPDGPAGDAATIEPEGRRGCRFEVSAGRRCPRAESDLFPLVRTAPAGWRSSPAGVWPGKLRVRCRFLVCRGSERTFGAHLVTSGSVRTKTYR